MLAPRTLPGKYAEFNRRHHSPSGHPWRGYFKVFGSSSALRLKLAGPYAWQENNSIRAFEYPWAYEQIQSLGSKLVVADVGASLAGLQYTLAREGHEVHAIDPGMQATGVGWEVDPEFHQRLANVYKAPVRLHATTLEDAGLPESSVDVVLSVSTIEHFGPDDFSRFAQAAKRTLKPGGHLVLTIDLFLDLKPFTGREQNEFGLNANVAQLLEQLDAKLVVGKVEELYGFPAFDADRVQSHLSEYLIGTGYPGMTQCLVARV